MAKVETGEGLFVGIAYHWASWEGAGGDYDIDEEGGTDEVVVGVFTTIELAKVGCEAYLEEHEPEEGGSGPLHAFAVHSSTLNQHGTGPWVAGLDVLRGEWKGQ